ncbi:3-hydroxyacyl-CoA dehydrogenase [Rhizobium sp. BK176]|nr:3-hydroxyacyl-CoA dehydrogenase [Rhizobium sp. BK181]MBB3543419.1 3-hydroxyacyl-CoA dehydrogenase [Rhizobium sp. BK399]MCS3743524.1 3-hydroxyacyl-CoA dehydrogenase [Rhizobium sp. BK661]MCS4095215.1 3-hydroxyacyl-CoA dehydrogenase [Rhizobium sp. BK176]
MFDKAWLKCEQPGRPCDPHPAPAMQLVELIRGDATSRETFETVYDVIKRLGKTAVVVDDYPGFTVHRTSFQ